MKMKMKKVMTIFGAILFTSIILTSCKSAHTLSSRGQTEHEKYPNQTVLGRRALIFLVEEHNQNLKKISMLKISKSNCFLV